MFLDKCKHRLRAKKSTMELVGVSVDDGVLFETYECSICEKIKVYNENGTLVYKGDQ